MAPFPHSWVFELKNPAGFFGKTIVSHKKTRGNPGIREISGCLSRALSGNRAGNLLRNDYPDLYFSGNFFDIPFPEIFPEILFRIFLDFIRHHVPVILSG